MTQRAGERRLIDRETSRLARRMAELGAGRPARLFQLPRWTDRMMHWAMDRPAFKAQLFRFVDVFPTLDDHRAVARHVSEYFTNVGGAADPAESAPSILRWGIGLANNLPLGARVETSIARRNIERMARQFIVGARPADAVAGLAALWRSGSAFTVDVLGEKTLTTLEADRYTARVEELLAVLADATSSWPADLRLERDDLGAPLPRVNLSVKPTALAPHFGPLTQEVGLDEARTRLRGILRHAARVGAFVNLDMEQYEVKDLTLQLFMEVLSEDEFVDQEAGIVIQAYLRDAQHDLAELIAWSAQRERPVTVRLVRGAYWDTETVAAQAEGWPAPVFQRKVETDANYERCVRMLHDHHGEVHAAFGSHNLRSLAYAVSYARHKGIPDNGYEIQTLFGMGEPIQAAMRGLGLRSRVYAPVGELVPGMAYLVRRLLENTSNESFLRHRVVEGRALEELLRPPSAATLPGPTPPRSRPPTNPADPDPYLPEPPTEWRRREERARFATAVGAVAAQGAVEVPALIDGEEVRTARTIRSVDPAHPDVLVASSASCGASEADEAVAAARRVAEAWRSTPARERAAVLFRAAAWLRERHAEIAALEGFEAGKPWDQADADVCEAIDFCEYYGREMLRLDGASADLVQSPPGEANRLVYQGKGVAAVIAPWNFPLAIPTGMTTAALVAGNPVILKPAEQTPLVARYLIDALLAAGAPRGVVQFLPGPGEEVGASLVAHPEVAVIAFTGSRGVGLEINQQAAVPLAGQRHVKRVVAEMGGKNALIIDADADPDEAVPAAAASAFGYAGQKCSAASRLVVLDGVYDQMVDRLARYAAELVVGHPRRPETQVGPLIDGEAHERVLGWVDKAAGSGRMRLRRDDVPEAGFFVGPTIVEMDDLRSPVVREEVFGPLLAVLRARDLDEAIAIANDTDYALTAGICSRSPAAIRKASAELRAGNVYVNRSITGSVVGRQPFGGYGLSGVGSKAGGPDYLLQFLDPRAITENTVRQGFAPDV
jgi:RHH-type transcriptional regulator, proline utilization regulon repressor / proline dehydrogenase / delta 1-pyrroline-5-carboxylate dehydrogenase